MDAISSFFMTLFVLFIAVPYVIIMVVLGVKLSNDWEHITEKERIFRSSAYWVLLAVGVLIPVFYYYPFLYQWLPSPLPLFLILPVAAWVYYLFAITRLVQKLDQTLDDVHSINQKINWD